MLTAVALSLVLAQAPQKVRWDPRIDLPVTGTLALGLVLTEGVFKKDLAPAACRWCATNTFDTAVRSVFNTSLTPSAAGVKSLDLVSYITVIAAPAVAVGLQAIYAAKEGVFLDTFFVDLLIIAETVVSPMMLNQVIKFSVGRARPFTIGATPELIAQGNDPPDAYISFFSGHTLLAFSSVSAAATLARLRGYKLWWLTWAVGLPIAATTGVLRIAADKHWATDVLLGSIVGVAAGVLMPTFLHGQVGPVNARVVPTGTGLAVTGTF